MMVTVLLWYLFAGALVWMLLDAIGITQASRHRHSAPHMVAATIVAIVIWPRFIPILARHPRGAAKWFKRKLWGRP